MVNHYKLFGNFAEGKVDSTTAMPIHTVGDPEKPVAVLGDGRWFDRSRASAWIDVNAGETLCRTVSGKWVLYDGSWAEITERQAAVWFLCNGMVVPALLSAEVKALEI